MNVLTKICVVVLLVLVLLACPVFITQATLAPNYRDAYERQFRRNEALVMNNRLKTLLAERLVAEINQRTQAANETQGELTRQVENLIAAQTRLQAENAQLRADYKKISGEMSDLRLLGKQNIERRVLLTNQLGETRKELDKVYKMYRRTEDLLMQARAEVERLEKVARVLRERLVELEEQIREKDEIIVKLKAGGAKGGEEAGPAMPPPRITGTVDSVRGDLIGVNIGSAKGLKPGMRLIIYRGAEFVAHLGVQEVDVNAAAGVVSDKRLDPIVGDKVTTSLK